MNEKEEETVLKLIQEDQEDRYHRTKDTLEDMLNITITSKEWNACFFEVIDEPYRAVRYLHNSRKRLVDALKVVEEYL